MFYNILVTNSLFLDYWVACPNQIAILSILSHEIDNYKGIIDKLWKRLGCARFGVINLLSKKDLINNYRQSYQDCLQLIDVKPFNRMNEGSGVLTNLLDSMFYLELHNKGAVIANWLGKIKQLNQSIILWKDNDRPKLIDEWCKIRPDYDFKKQIDKWDNLFLTIYVIKNNEISILYHNVIKEEFSFFALVDVLDRLVMHPKLLVDCRDSIIGYQWMSAKLQVNLANRFFEIS